MGGLGSRFRKVGYTIPKYEIKARGKSLFTWSMLSLQAFFDEKFIFIVRKEDHATDFIRSQCNDLNINYEIVYLDKLTKGQAESAVYAQSVWDENDGILVYNIDTYVEPYSMRPDTMKGDGCIPCFHAEGTHWSFVRLDENGRVVEVREKNRISDNCSIGAYYFKTAGLYKKIYDKFYKDTLYMEKGEQYIAPMYNYMIEQGYDIQMLDIPAGKVHVLGTPEEVEVFCQ